MQALSTAAPGKVYTIKWMFGLPEVLDIIRNCQIEEGSEIRVFEKFKSICRKKKRSMRIHLRCFMLLFLISEQHFYHLHMQISGKNLNYDIIYFEDSRITFI